MSHCALPRLGECAAADQGGPVIMNATDFRALYLTYLPLILAMILVLGCGVHCPLCAGPERHHCAWCKTVDLRCFPVDIVSHATDVVL